MISVAGECGWMDMMAGRRESKAAKKTTQISSYSVVHTHDAGLASAPLMSACCMPSGYSRPSVHANIRAAEPNQPIA